MNEIKVSRKTTESVMKVVISPAPLNEDYRKKINTPLAFLNHMIEHIAWRANLNIETEVKLDEFFLAHVVAEDLGIALGKACAEYIKRNSSVGFSSALSIIDEAKAECALSFENRSYIGFSSNVDIPERVEDMASEDLEVFLEGFCQGANCTMHIDILKGTNAHHIWEAAFRSFGLALGRALEVNEARKNMTSSVAGAIDWIIE